MGIKDSLINFCPFNGVLSWYQESEMREHLLNARKEALLALKSLIDEGIERTERGMENGKATKVEVK